MFENTWHAIETLLAPIIAAQIFLVVLIYFTIVRRRIAADYKLYVCFLGAFIGFLVLRPVQYFWGDVMPMVLFVRITLLFGISLPSLLVASFVQSGVPRCLSLYVWCFGGGLGFTLTYCIILAGAWGQFGLNREMLAWLPWQVTTGLAHIVQIAGAIALLVLPCSYLIVQELRSSRNPKILAFLTGALLFGILLALGTSSAFDYSIYYVGSIFSALCWAWVVYQDVHDMKGKVTLVKEELQLLVQSGQESIAPEVEKLLEDLEELSKGNLDVYKLRIREILSMLTDATIQAGGDTDTLIRRNTDIAQKIDTSSDPNEMRKVIHSEAIELSEIIAEIPEKRTNVIVEKAKAYIEKHYGEELSVESIAKSLGSSRSHFMREFKKGTGQTVNQYLTNYRVEQAKLLLVEKSVTETAFEVGFNNSNYFSTVFKKQTGMRPVQFQESLKKK
ncbi:AraC family transcriptional regulator [Rubellicoccus peritrichatus]|uniref:AraC family transcriptional regulator n=1 Tax=Rubellicoccus peritrichatus TaxID=3080537 RepID=A0AAQ3LBP4_9BACT|nr:AraC family transcriptional regulator [Puniceicoccus sp. CR14]WOO42357.1 AraC family transcriptional regulator [Puniceicoccus sp. CR14]